jgi:hypothetical protein
MFYLRLNAVCRLCVIKRNQAFLSALESSVYLLYSTVLSLIFGTLTVPVHIDIV